MLCMSNVCIATSSTRLRSPSSRSLVFFLHVLSQTNAHSLFLLVTIQLGIFFKHLFPRSSLYCFASAELRSAIIHVEISWSITKDALNSPRCLHWVVAKVVVSCVSCVAVNINVLCMVFFGRGAIRKRDSIIVAVITNSWVALVKLVYVTPLTFLCIAVVGKYFCQRVEFESKEAEGAMLGSGCVMWCRVWN